MSRYDPYDTVPLDGVQVGGFEESLDSANWNGAAAKTAPAAPEAEPSAEPSDRPSAEPDPNAFLIGADAVRDFVAREWKRRLDYRLKKEVWSYSGDRVSILFEYEWHDPETDQWMLTHGEEHWEIAPDGLLHRVKAACQDIAIAEIDRWILPKPRLEPAEAD